jgi:hypothetical protein
MTEIAHTISNEQLKAKVGTLLETFYKKRIEALGGLKLVDVLKRKNPYLYRATSSGNPTDIVEELLKARISSSDETIFGNEFFEPLAGWVASQAYQHDPSVSVRVSSGSGVDIEIESDTKIMLIAVKSGTSVFNAQSLAKQKDQFNQARKRLMKVQKQFDPVVGYSYGRVKSKEAAFRTLAGQAFWEELSGERDFYLRLVDAMEECSLVHAVVFKSEFDKAVNRFTRELLDEFADSEGQLDWRKIVAFNSSRNSPQQRKRK